MSVADMAMRRELLRFTLWVLSAFAASVIAVILIVSYVTPLSGEVAGEVLIGVPRHEHPLTCDVGLGSTRIWFARPDRPVPAWSRANRPLDEGGMKWGEIEVGVGFPFRATRAVVQPLIAIRRGEFSVDASLASSLASDASDGISGGLYLRQRRLSMDDAVFLLPVSPIWSGLLANWAIHAVALVVLIQFSKLARRGLRSLRGRCADCGYESSRTATPACPECGARRPVRDR